jgi:hypothetical protein
MMQPWMDPLKFGLFYGAIGGTVVALSSAALAVAAAKLAPLGKGRNFVLGSFAFMIAIGLVNLVIGFYALSSHQPYGIWYPFVIIGTVVTIVYGALRPMLQKRYKDVEARKIEAAALRRA